MGNKGSIMQYLGRHSSTPSLYNVNSDVNLTIDTKHDIGVNTEKVKYRQKKKNKVQETKPNIMIKNEIKTEVEDSNKKIPYDLKPNDQIDVFDSNENKTNIQDKQESSITITKL